MRKLFTALLAAAFLCGGPAFAEAGFSLVSKNFKPEYRLSSPSPAPVPASRVSFTFLREDVRYGLFPVETAVNGPGFQRASEEKLFRGLNRERELFNRGIFLFEFRREDYMNILKLSDRPLEEQYRILKHMILKKKRLETADG
ncbi:hypothetical protein ACFLQK_01015 [bacterium]